jgi:hypothetical protein
MSAEVEELERQNTWDILKLPEGRKALGRRWVYKIKRDKYNNILKYKAR